MKIKITQFVRIRVVFALLAIVMLSGAVHAGLICRSDPVVILSNGMTLDIGATISTLPWQVKEVHYELHVPAGVRMILAIHTPTWLTSQETFTVFSDQPKDQYQVVTQVITSQGNATVTADTTLVSALNVRLGRFTVSGQEKARLSLWFHNSFSGR